MNNLQAFRDSVERELNMVKNKLHAEKDRQWMKERQAVLEEVLLMVKEFMNK